MPASYPADVAVIGVDTQNAPALHLDDASQVAVGRKADYLQRGKRNQGDWEGGCYRQERCGGSEIDCRFSPPLALEAAGAPLLDENGNVVGILGGNVMPGARFDARHMSVNPSFDSANRAANSATPAAAIPRDVPEIELVELEGAGKLTMPFTDMDGILYVTTSSEATKSATDPLPRDVYDFSRRDKQVWVISEWQQKGKISKGMLSATVYDDQNHVRAIVAPKKVSLPSTALRYSSVSRQTSWSRVPTALICSGTAKRSGGPSAAVTADLIAGWSKSVSLAHFRELVIGVAPDSSGAAGPWVELRAWRSSIVGREYEFNRRRTGQPRPRG